MKIQDKAFFAGNEAVHVSHNQNTDKQAGKKSIQGNLLNEKHDPILIKRQQAQKRAMKIVGDAWENDKRIDDEITQRRNRIAQHQSTIDEMNTRLKEIADNRLVLRDANGLTEEDEEEKNLRLLERKIEADNPRSGVALTEDEKREVQKIEKAGITPYQELSLGMKKAEGLYNDELREAQKGLEQETAMITAIRNEMLKSQSMLKADENAQKVLENAGKEIVGMLIDEAKEHIDEEMKDEKEAAQERTEKEELEEKVEKKEEKKEKQERQKEIITDSTEYMVKLDTTMEDVQQEVKKIIKEMNLMKEDLKGAAVDSLN